MSGTATAAATRDRIVVVMPAYNADACFGSRMSGGQALQGGMPRWKYAANVALTAVESLCLGLRLAEHHSGFRAYSRRYLEAAKLEANSAAFVFDTEIIAQGELKGMRIHEIPIATRYFPERPRSASLPASARVSGSWR